MGRRTKKQQVVIERDVYEAVVFAALSEGGVGRARYFDQFGMIGRPLCVYGMAMHAQVPDNGKILWFNNITPEQFDEAVFEVQLKEGKTWSVLNRVSIFKVFKKLGIVPSER